ncbi:MAG: xanthine dehydrogenase family protein molybdopterin-binding subunit [Gammaproteobacteria bacterium]|nr:xanthine dehydrogenase family protein molybdopterin-binding subunit [Pseudomonadales bacterium]MCP5348714.1 xanthine dehydrogenase family protein molybdopterin-binding subunit [Pseudomonadales bacterium]
MSEQVNQAVEPLATIGNATPRIDAVERVTGTARYTRDQRLPGMLYARILRSRLPHARIVRIDTSRAEQLAGVVSVITHENAQVVWGAGSVSGGRQYNDPVKEATLHRRYIFNNPVRFVGEPIAAVAATDRHIAEQALSLIEVEYEALPFVLDPEAALQESAAKVWPEGNLAPDAGNRFQPMVTRRGEIDAGFAQADRVFEDRYSTAFIHNAQMEPRCALAHWEGDRLTLYSPTQGISNCRHDTARDLGLADHQVRVVCQYMGGGFGNKNQNQDTDLIAATLSRRSSAPVMVEYSRKEDWVRVHGRWPTVQYYKIGVTNEGTVTAMQMNAYSGMGPYRKNSGGISGMDGYACENLERVIYPVYTNRTVSGNFRAPSEPHGHFGIESMMDEIAYQLGLDPVEFTLRNMRRPTEASPFTNYSLDQCIARGVELFDWPNRRRTSPGSDNGPLKRGAGFSFMMFRAGVGSSSAIVRVDGDQSYTLYVGVTDIGPGAKTTMGMIAAEELGVPLSRVEVVSGDTDRCPYSVGESGSRTTIMTGYAVVEACRDLKRQVAQKGFPSTGEVLIASATPTPTTDGKIRNCFAAHFCEVEVDTRLGTSQVTKYVAVHESGRLINPQTARDQIRGATIQGIGQALHENTLYDSNTGQPLTSGYYSGRLATHLDVPDIEVEFIEVDDGYGPFGAKTAGEAGIILSPAAVANAVSNAIGRRMKDLPITRNRVLEVLS